MGFLGKDFYPYYTQLVFLGENVIQERAIVKEFKPVHVKKHLIRLISSPKCCRALSIIVVLYCILMEQISILLFKSK